MRLRTLPAAAVPVVVGGAVAYRENVLQPLSLFAALIGALLIQIGANFANDLFDFQKGADTAERVGPVRVTQAGLLTPKQVGFGAVMAFVLASLCGLYLIWFSGWPVAIIGVLSIISAVLYVGGPLPYGYRGLGEFFVILFFGVVAVCGTYFVQALKVSPMAAVASIPIGFLCANILVVNNVRDIETDRVADKRTLAVQFGRDFGLHEYATMLLLSHAIVLVAAIAGLLPIGSLIVLLTLPYGWKLYKRLESLTGPALNPILGASAQYELLFGALLSIGILVPIQF